MSRARELLVLIEALYLADHYLTTTTADWDSLFVPGMRSLKVLGRIVTNVIGTERRRKTRVKLDWI